MASINLQGDTSGSISISAPSVAGSNTLTLPATTQTLATQNSLGVRNLIINGDMQIAQRGTTATGITTSGYYTCDRWRIASNIGTFTNTQDTDVPTGQGFSYSYKLACTSTASLTTTSLLLFQQLIEGQNLQHIKKGTSSAESLTLSFWVKSNKTGTHIAELYENANIRSISSQFTISTANTWEKKTITFAGDTTGAIANDNTTGITLNLWLTTGSNYSSGTLNTSWASSTPANRAVGQNINLADSTSNYINITGVQLEVGDTATPFEHRPYDMELQRCLRYFHQHTFTDNQEAVANLTSWTGTVAYGYMRYPTIFRATPTLSVSNATDLEYLSGGNIRDCVTFIPAEGTKETVQMGVTVASGLTIGQGGWLRANNVSADGTQYIRYDAEL